LAILDKNWMGHATSPGRLYPHQWSWDAASIAMGRAAWDQEREETELRSLFGGQWRTGLVPHIVFTDSADYFPGPPFWQTERSPDAPRDPRTSGILQPPIHATATWRVYQRARDRPRAAAFLHELFPKLVRWHEYLYRERTRDGEGLAEVWHPWESGMDNSPAWDEALQRIVLTRDQIPEYERIDDRRGNPAERPTSFDYDRYTYLVSLFRSLNYNDADIREACPFVIQSVLFNSLLAQADRDLAKIARIVGADPQPFERWAETTTHAMGKLWDPDRGVYLDYDVRAESRVPTWTAAAFAPLYAHAPTQQQAHQLVTLLAATRAKLGGDWWAVPSLAAENPKFQPTLYHRGPVWAIHQWTSFQGCAKYGYSGLAEQIRSSTIEVSRRSGIWEHYHPLTGRGQGDPAFAWTAGLVLDMLCEQPGTDER
jgi:hypothetical protein